jgi:FYVE/RhoGEF/PH domain-containing protein 5/6
MRKHAYSHSAELNVSHIHAMSSSTQLLFPSTDPDSGSVSSLSPQPLVTHLPFRRMSLPTAPNLNLNRQSVVSFASFESLSEHGTSQSQIASPSKKFRSRRTSVDAHRKGPRRRGHHTLDKERDTKRCKVIQEFYETERTYVQGLDLIYEVS